MENKQPRNANGKFKQLPSKQALLDTIEQQKNHIEQLDKAISRLKCDNYDLRLKEQFLLDNAAWWTKRKYNKQFPI